MIKITSCKTCTNCDSLRRWEALYKSHLKDYPQQKNWIKKMREMDKKNLPCLAPKKIKFLLEDKYLPPDYLLTYEDAEKLALQQQGYYVEEKHHD